MVSKREREAEGISNVVPSLRSIVFPCNTNNVPIWLYTVLKMIPVVQIGRSLMIDLSSSTCVTVQSLHGLFEPLVLSDCVSTAALSKKLHIQES